MIPINVPPRGGKIDNVSGNGNDCPEGGITPRARSRGAFIAMVGSLAMSPVASAQCEDILMPDDATAFQNFGMSVAVSGNVVLVGASQDGENGPAAGSVYVYSLSEGWQQTQKLAPSDAAAWDQFGNAIAVSGDVAVIGSWLDDDGAISAGSAYVFRRNGSTWEQEQKLVASDAGEGDIFGSSVAIYNDLIVIGAREDDIAGTKSGSAYIFRFDGNAWSEEAHLVASDAAAGDQFGFSVAVADGLIVVGAPYDADNGTNSGAVYVYSDAGQGWSEDKYVPDSLTPYDNFGLAVAANDGRWAGSAPKADGIVSNSGVVLCYEWVAGEWAGPTEIFSTDSLSGDAFGSAVAMTADALVVGAYLDDDAGLDSGSAYLYRLSNGTWDPDRKLSTTGLAAGDWFGTAVAVSANFLVIGAGRDDDAGTDSGTSCTFLVDAAVGCDTADADLNDDGVVDVQDLLALMGEWGCSGQCAADLNGDGWVDLADLIALIGAWD